MTAKRAGRRAFRMDYSHIFREEVPPAVWGGIRIAVEIAIGRIDKFRRVILRSDSHIRNFKSFHYLACACIVP